MARAQRIDLSFGSRVGEAKDYQGLPGVFSGIQFGGCANKCISFVVWQCGASCARKS